MIISESQDEPRKLGLISIGSKIAHFNVTNINRRFTVHEDLICYTSYFFKSQLQRRRKPVSASCSICFDDLNPRITDISFCDKCGQNFHEVCIDEWIADHSTCPMCRGAWRDKPVPEVVQIQEALDAEAVQVYITWLYSRTLNVDAAISHQTDDFNLKLLQCWEVSIVFEDDAFKDVVIHTFFTEAKAMFWSKSIKFAFEDERGSDDMRNFIVRIFMTRMKEGWFKTESKKWPRTFVEALADEYLDKDLDDTYGRERFDDVKAEYLGT